MTRHSKNRERDLLTHIPLVAANALSEAARIYRTSIFAIRNPDIRVSHVSAARRYAAELLRRHPARAVAEWMGVRRTTVYSWRNRRAK